MTLKNLILRNNGFMHGIIISTLWCYDKDEFGK